MNTSPSKNRFLWMLVLASCSLATTARASQVDHTTFDRLLGRYVVEERYVRYDRWHDNPADLESLREYVRTLEGVDTRELGRDDALAYWINLYNATTLRLILDHYPVKSIKDLGGKLSSAWDKELVRIDGRPTSLNDIENRIIRPTFRDPRIHFALNCASMSCPPLAPFAYDGDRIEEQLEAAARRAVTDPYWVDATGCGTYGKGKLRLSKIFDWYQEDFGGESGVRSFLAHYLPAKKLPLQNGGCSLDYKDYDWNLNLPPEGENSR